MSESEILLFLEAYSPFPFVVSGKAWVAYDLLELAEPRPGGEAAPRVYAMRELADRMNRRRAGGHTYPVEPLHAGQLLALGLLTEVWRYVMDRYCLADCAGALLQGFQTAATEHGPALVDRPVLTFAELYPPETVHRGGTTAGAYLEGVLSGVPHRHLTGREMLLLHLSSNNPALRPFQELYDDEELRRQAPYEPLIHALESHFAVLPPVPGSGETLLNFLRTPVRLHPDSLEAQLDYVTRNWAFLLPARLLERLRLTLDVIREETRLRGHGPGPTQVLDFEALMDWAYPEPAQFTADRDWMSNVVLIAKSTYVWLDQLSKQYGRPLRRLDEIPDEELDRLARWGFTGLWLIGVWERSTASQKIKQIMGNPEAVASAYSLYDYVIAEDLGGPAAYANLRDRAWRRGIRLASDMVPNHVGLYSRWAIEHPDWFIQLAHPPFPSYRFTGADLSEDPRVGLRIEDGYWTNSDAAVVFQRTDNWTGDVRYIYHGNDGTNMPWNDTAQLNFLLPEVREAVIQTILHVARQFPIIRFDAAMTLAKKHYQRLWFPRPGDAGAIPSRAEHGMTQAEFNAAFPREFWRDVVDRVQQEAPDTLLLAEAFWLMEGYFVRTLGMHRVYNSAFMNMLKMEENSKYRLTVRNVLEFSPEVIKRFVNFMNNPDERTAADQFGKGDKYFGIAVLMVTMPGLPMFGHGQIEGFTEKYGMEYRRAYWDEGVDEGLVARHEREIFPLMRKRHLFSGAEHFAFYDCVTPEGWVDENVFAYSNRAGAERALIIYNNAYAATRGRVHLSTAINVGDAQSKDLVRKTLAEALDLDTQEGCFHIFRDHRTQLEYIRSGRRIGQEGLFLELHAYEYNAFLDFRAVYDVDGTWRRLEAALDGRGVTSIDEAYRELMLEPILEPFRAVMNPAMLKTLRRPFALPEARERFEKAFEGYLAAVRTHMGRPLEPKALLALATRELDVLHDFPARLNTLRAPKALKVYVAAGLPAPDAEALAFWRIPIALVLADQTTRARAAADYSARPASDIAEWRLARVIGDAFAAEDPDAESARRDASLVELLSAHEAALDFAPEAGGALLWRRLLDDPAARRFLCVNRYQGRLWASKEQFERLVYWTVFESAVAALAEPRARRGGLSVRFDNARRALAAMEQAGYQLDAFLTLLQRGPEA